MILRELKEPVALVLGHCKVRIEPLSVLESDERYDLFIRLADLCVAVSDLEFTGIETKHRDVRRQSRFEAAGAIGERHSFCWVARDALDNISQREPKSQHRAHHIRQRFYWPDDVELLQVGTDSVRDQILGKRLFGNVPREIVSPESEIENDSAAFGLSYHGNHFAAVIDNAAQIAVIKMGDHVAGLRDAESLRRQQMLRVLHLEFADVHVKGKPQNLRKSFGQMERSRTIIADRVALDIAQHIAMFFSKIYPPGNRHFT